MAVAVPILLGAAGASTVVTVAATVVMAVTGIGDKINKAASKVFGKDLVNFANIAGSLFMASGGDLNNLFGAGGAEAAASGALSSAGEAAGAIDGMAAFEAAGNAAATTTADAFSTGAFSAPAASVQVPGIAPAAQMSLAMPSQVPSAVEPGGIKGALKSASEWWDKQPDRVKASLIQVGGNTLAGAAQGYQQAKMLEEQQKERQRREAIFNAGSGVTSTYGPRTPVVKTGGG